MFFNFIWSVVEHHVCFEILTFAFFSLPCLSEEDFTGEEEMPSFRGIGPHTHKHTCLTTTSNSHTNLCHWMFLQVVAEAAVWGASRATLSSWLSKSSMDLLHSSSLLWQCWHHLVSFSFVWQSRFNQWIIIQVNIQNTLYIVSLTLPQRHWSLRLDWVNWLVIC